MKKLFGVSFKSTGSVTIDGRDLVGRSIVINGDKVLVDGVEETGSLVGPIYITVTGDVAQLVATSGSVEVTGACGTVATTSGNIHCGDVTGDVGTMSGSVTCGAVAGDINSMSGSIRTGGRS